MRVQSSRRAGAWFIVLLFLLSIPLFPLYASAGGDSPSAGALLSAAAEPEVAALQAEDTWRQASLVTLEEALQAALAASPDLRQAALALQAAQQQFAQTQAQNRIGVDGSAGYSGTNIESTDTESLLVRQGVRNQLDAGVQLSYPNTQVGVNASHTLPSDWFGNYSSLSLSLSQTLWDGVLGGRSTITVEQGRLTLQGEELSFEDSRQQLLLQVRQAYYALASGQRTVSLQEQNVAQRQEELSRTQTLNEAGRASALELQQAQVNLRSAQVELTSARHERFSAQAELSLLLGWPPDREYRAKDFADATAPAPELASASLSELLAEAYANRIDLKQAGLQRQSAELDLKGERSSQWPVLSANGSVTYSRDWDTGSDELGWRAGLQASWSLFDSGLLRSQIDQAELSIEQARAQEQNLRASIAAEVQKNLFALQDALQTLEVSQQSYDLAGQQYELTTTKQALGLASSLEVLVQSVQLQDARIALEKARADADLALVNLQQSMGRR
jgi:outer membrane protein